MRASRPLPPLLFYTLLACAATWPLVTAAGRVLAGDPRADAWKHAWGFWWFADAARHGVLFPTRTDLLGFPGGGSMYNIDPLNSLLSVPLQGLLPLSWTFNLLLLVNLVAGAMAAWALARDVTGDPWCALPAGVAYALSPFVLSYAVASGVTETTSLVWLPLFLLALLRLPERGTGHAALTGALLGLTAFSCWYYGIFALIWAVLWGIGQGVRLLRAPPLARRERLRALALRIAVVAIITADVAAPPLMAFWMSMSNPDSLHPADFKRTPASASAYLDPSNAVAVTDYIAVGKARAVVSHTSDRLVRSAYVGIVVLMLGAVAGVSDRKARFWLVSALLFGGLSLGPTLQWTRAEGGGSAVNPLYSAFYRGFPGFTQVAIPFRCCVPLMLAGGVLAALGLQRVTTHPSLGAESRRKTLALVTSSLMLADFLVLSPAPWPLPTLSPPTPDALSALANVPAGAGVLDLPLDWVTDEDKLLPGAYFYAQSIHGRPIPYRVSGHMTTAVETHPIVGIVRALTVPELAPSHPPDATSLRDSVSSLTRLGFGAIVLHRGYIAPARRASVQATLDAALGPPVANGDDRIYVLARTTETTTP